MSDDIQWREKYRDSLSRLSAEEVRRSRLQSILRLLIGRLCVAGQGRDPRLDAELHKLAATVRKGIDPQGLEALLDPLSQAVTVLETQTHANPAAAAEPLAAPNGEGAGTLPLLEQLALLPELRSMIAGLRTDTTQPLGAADLAALLERVARLASEQRAAAQREKLELEHLLQQLTSRLDEIAAHLAGEVEEQNAAQDDTEKLNLLVSSEVEELKTNVMRSLDLPAMRDQVSLRLAAINGHLHEFRGREESRVKTYRERVGRMRSRIRELERESHGLHISLQEEQRLAMVDALTGIPNRAAYDERIEQEFRRWKRFGRTISILAWDIDHFKSINDAYGHRAGDRVLRIFGQQLDKHVRETDFVARYGGEEFVMLLVGSSPAEAHTVADKIRIEISQLGFHFHDKPVTVTASCGITNFIAEDTPDAAFDRADRALYQAKEAGRNRCVVG
ncbi:MAG TPA: GGDEF domain-containing protein [Steroidobacteraceae bacterium]|jgi:diguanylate cyclase|nr:GGDEF domain-containing protein [Steroidobacteraceae bacterium]